MRVTKTTPELRVGDVVLHYGGRVELVREILRRECCEGWETVNRFGNPNGHCEPEHGHGDLVCFVGVIRNADDPECALLPYAMAERPYRVRSRQWVPEGNEPLWTIQGNARARWAVES